MRRADKRQLLVDHYLDFYSVAMAMLKDEDDAKEVVQEALTRTLLKRRLKDPCGYCVRIIRHLSLDMLHHRSRLMQVDEMMLVSDYEHEELLRAVSEKKEELPVVAQTVLELHYEEDYTLSEVAGMLQMSVSTVKRILSDAQYSLRKKLEEEI